MIRTLKWRAAAAWPVWTVLLSLAAGCITFVAVRFVAKLAIVSYRQGQFASRPELENWADPTRDASGGLPVLVAAALAGILVSSLCLRLVQRWRAARARPLPKSMQF